MNNRYKLAAYPEPTNSISDGCLSSSGQQQHPLSHPPLVNPVDAATHATSQLQLQHPQMPAPTNQPPPSSHQSNQSSNIVSSNNSTNKPVINQSSASRKKNRRIGRHESRYTSGNNFHLFIISVVLLVFC